MYHHQDRQNTVSSTISQTSRRSDKSYSSQSTAATSIYEDPEETPTRQLRHTSTPRYCTVTYGDAQGSRSSCGSSGVSEEDLYEEPEEYNDGDYDYTTPSYANPSYSIPSSNTIETIPTTPQDFATYFPSQRRLNIQHDPTTDDGNMNLIISTELVEDNREIHMQLFHLRMHDLITRQFSLRRYCRDSGREVCHSITRMGPPTTHRPTLQRSMSNAFASVKRTNSWGSSKSSKSSKSFKFEPARQDSGYATNSDDEDIDEEDTDYQTSSAAPKPTNTIKLEFSNYAQVDVKRRGAKGNKRWEFEYWGNLYAWKRVTNHDGASKSYSYHLVKNDSGQPIAHIVPEVRTTDQAREEEHMGGWVPPCSLWISDTKVVGDSSDVADVVVSTGLIALADDCVRQLTKRNGQTKPVFKRQISLPLTPVKLDMEFVHPKEMMRHMFRRGSKDSADAGSRPGTAKSGSLLGKSPLRFHSPVEAC